MHVHYFSLTTWVYNVFFCNGIHYSLQVYCVLHVSELITIMLPSLEGAKFIHSAIALSYNYAMVQI